MDSSERFASPFQCFETVLILSARRRDKRLDFPNRWAEVGGDGSSPGGDGPGAFPQVRSSNGALEVTMRPKSSQCFDPIVEDPLVEWTRLSEGLMSRCELPRGPLRNNQATFP